MSIPEYVTSKTYKLERELQLRTSVLNNLAQRMRNANSNDELVDSMYVFLEHSAKYRSTLLELVEEHTHVVAKEIAIYQRKIDEFAERSTSP